MTRSKSSGGRDCSNKEGRMKVEEAKGQRLVSRKTNDGEELKRNKERVDEEE